MKSWHSILYYMPESNYKTHSKKVNSCCCRAPPWPQAARPALSRPNEAFAAGLRWPACTFWACRESSRTAAGQKSTRWKPFGGGGSRAVWALLFLQNVLDERIAILFLLVGECCRNRRRGKVLYGHETDHARVMQTLDIVENHAHSLVDKKACLKELKRG